MRRLHDDRFARGAGFAGGVEDDLADAVPTQARLGLLVGIRRIVRQGQFEIGVGALAVSGVEGDPDRLVGVDRCLGETGTSWGERIVIRDEAECRALAHGLDADEVGVHLEAGRRQDGAVLAREGVGVQTGGQNVFEHVRSAGFDPEVAGREASVEAITMATPGGGSPVVQGPVRFFTARRLGFLGFQSDAQEGGGVQRIGGVLFALEALSEFTVGSIEGRDLGAQLIGLGAQGVELFALGGNRREFTTECTGAEGVGDLGGGQRKAIQTGFLEFALKEGIAAAGVASAEEQARLGLSEGMQGCLLVGGGVAGAIGLAVTEECDASVGLIDDGEVDEFAGFGRLGRTVDILGTDTVVAAGHPFRFLLFGEDE